MPAALEPFGAHVRRAASVVPHLEPEPAGIPRDRDVDAAGAGVAPHVRERLLQRAEQGQLRLLRQRRERGGRREGDPDGAVVAEVRHQRAQRGQEAEVVEQRGPEIVGDAPDAPDAGVDQREGLVEPFAERRAHPFAQHPELHLHRAEDLRRLVVQLARQPAALLLVLLDHARGEPRQLDRARLQAGGEVSVLERGAHLLAQRHEEAVVERGERIARVAHEHERADDRIAPEQRQHGGVGERGGAGLAPVAGHLRQAGLVRAREDGGGRGVELLGSHGAGTRPRRGRDPDGRPSS